MKIKQVFVGILSLLLLASCGSNNVSHTHTYTGPTWAWDGFSSAHATFECSACSKETKGHYVILDGDINAKITKQATCVDSGEKTYIATVVFQENTYQDEKIDTIAPSGHIYSGPVWTWTDYSAAKATFTCASCSEETKGHKVDVDGTITSTHVEGTCLVKESYTYTATASFDDKSYSDQKVQTLDYGEHKYGEFHTDKEPTYTEEGSKSRTCELCKHVDTVAIPKLTLPYSVVKPVLVAADEKDSSDVYSGDYYDKALTYYSRLDLNSMTLEDKFEANELKNSIQEKKGEWDELYNKILDVSELTTFEDTETKIVEDKDGKGNCLEVKSLINEGEKFVYTPNLNIDIGNADYVTFGFYQDQPGDLIAVDAKWTKFLDLLTGEFYTELHPTKGILYKKWNQITISKDKWVEMGDFNIGIYLSHDLNYGIKTGGEPAYLTSFYAYSVPSQEGQVVIKGANNISDPNTWASKVNKTEIKYNISTPYGNATQVDIKAKDTVVELEWNNVNYASLAKFDFARIYIYAKTTQRVFISLANWRNNVASIPGVKPSASNNGAIANSIQSIANVVADQWNIIDIPTSYFMEDTNDSFYIEIWADQNVAKDDWLFTDFTGHYSTYTLDNAGTMIEGLGTKSVNLTTDSDETYGSLQKIELVQSKGYIKQNRDMNIGEFDLLVFDVYNPSESAKQMLLYKLTSTVYGNAVKGSYLTVTLDAKCYTHIEINILEYFGTYAANASVMLRFDGAVGDIFYITSLFGKINQSGHKHSYGELVNEVPASCVVDGIAAHYHCDKCGKNFDENKVELETIIIPAHGHQYEVEGDKYVCSVCTDELEIAEELVVKKQKETKQYIFLGSSICNGYHGPKVAECTSMADFFKDDYLLASYNVVRNGEQVSVKNAYLRRIENSGTTQEPYLGKYSYDYDLIELATNGVGYFNGDQFGYSYEDGRLMINDLGKYTYKFHNQNHTFGK